MKKIPTLFVRDYSEPRAPRLTAALTPGCEWVLDGEGVATRKFDGTCVMLDSDGRWWARREVKAGKTPPPGFMREQHDETTGKSVGWEPVEQSSFLRFLEEALVPATVENSAGWKPGTYELCGPKINGNPEGFNAHILIPHGMFKVGAPRTYAGLREYLAEHDWEGLVWHHPDGRMAKIKKRDYA